jgi:hypothetical protein
MKAYGAMKIKLHAIFYTSVLKVSSGFRAPSILLPVGLFTGHELRGFQLQI